MSTSIFGAKHKPACRNHMVLLRPNWEFPGSKEGLPWVGWAEIDKHGIDSNDFFTVQNDWKWSPGTDKGQLVKQYLRLAAEQARSKHKIFLNFLSYNRPAEFPVDNAEAMNPGIRNYLAQSISRNTTVGILPLDFTSNTGNPGTGCLENEIIAHNHFKPGVRYF